MARIYRVKMLMQEDHWSQQARALGLILRCAGMSAVAYAIRRRNCERNRV